MHAHGQGAFSSQAGAGSARGRAAQSVGRCAGVVAPAQGTAQWCAGGQRPPLAPPPPPPPLPPSSGSGRCAISCRACSDERTGAAGSTRPRLGERRGMELSWAAPDMRVFAGGAVTLSSYTRLSLLSHEVKHKQLGWAVQPELYLSSLSWPAAAPLPLPPPPAAAPLPPPPLPAAAGGLPLSPLPCSPAAGGGRPPSPPLLPKQRFTLPRPLQSTCPPRRQPCSAALEGRRCTAGR